MKYIFSVGTIKDKAEQINVSNKEIRPQKLIELAIVDKVISYCSSNLFPT